MAGSVSREAYFDTGLDILSDLGYGGLKLAEVCGRLGVTTGSFYHYFQNWPAYTKDLVAHWMQARTVRVIEVLTAESDPRRRIDALVQEALALPHGAEAAIRQWSATNPDVHGVQVTVDQQRFDVLYDAAFEILQHTRPAQLFAAWGVYLLVGYEQCTLPPDPEALDWIARQLLEALDSGRFAFAPDPH